LGLELIKFIERRTKMKKLLIVMVMVALVLPASWAFAKGKPVFTGPKQQSGADIEGPRGFSHNQKTFVPNPTPGYNPVPPGWVKGPKTSFLNDPNPEPKGFDKGQGFGFAPKL
jgi:hypothetical protein